MNDSVFSFYVVVPNVLNMHIWPKILQRPSRCVIEYKCVLLSKSTIVNNQHCDKISITSRRHVSAVKQPSSDQSGTYIRYKEIVHSMGSHIVCNNMLKIDNSCKIKIRVKSAVRSPYYGGVLRRKIPP